MKRAILTALILAAGLVLAARVTAQQDVQINPRVERDVVYGEVGGEQLKLDIYRPFSDGRHAAVITIHGGGWSTGDKQSDRAMAMRLARDDYVVFSINYRMSPTHRWPAAFDDCQRAVRWVRAHADEYEVRQNRIAALGWSAGAHLAALLGTVRQTRDNSDEALRRANSQVNAVVDFFGPSDLAGFPAGAAGTSAVRGFLGATPAQNPERYEAASPLKQVDRRSAPFLLIHGTLDAIVPVEQSRLLDEALRVNGRRSQLLILDGAGHGWPAESDYARRANEAVLAFLQRELRD